MDYANFVHQIHQVLPPNCTIPNPGGGTTTILKYVSDTLVYQRGHSQIRVQLQHFFSAYQKFQGRTASSTDLKAFNPSAFDSKAGGHSCNCTVFFSFLVLAKLADRIHGAGVAHNPFWVRITGI